MIDEVWDALRSDISYPAGVVRRRVEPSAPLGLFAAVEHPSRTPLLIVEAPTSAIPRGFTVPDAAGFSMVVRSGTGTTIEVELRLLDVSGEAIFRSFVDSAVEAICTTDNDRQAFIELARSVHSWQEFFRKHGSEGLSPGSQQGLFGELWFLREYLATALPASRCVDMWVGPTGANQDFEACAYALEVKTTTSNPLRSIRISNLRQLDDGCLDALRLILIEAERHPNGMKTLPWAVTATRELVRDHAPERLAQFNDLLIDYGYLDRDAPRYEDTGYSVRGMRCFAVSDAFPRLTEATVPAGIGNVEYSIALEAAIPHELEPDRLTEELGDLNGDSQRTRDSRVCP